MTGIVRCHQCDTEFLAQRPGQAKWCSTRCQSRHNEQHRAKRTGPSRAKKRLISCIYCRETFAILPDRVNPLCRCKPPTATPALRSCNWCGAPLTAYKRCFCSTRCRRIIETLERNGTSRSVRYSRCDRCGLNFSCPAELDKRFCSDRCMKAAGKRRREHRQRTNGPIEYFNLQEIVERDHGICHLCNEPVDQTAQVPDIAAPTLDHITPVSQGGAHTRDNVKLAHFMCNTLRGTTPVDRYAA